MLSWYLLGFFFFLDLVVPVSSVVCSTRARSVSDPRSRSSCSEDAEFDTEVKATLIALCTV